MNKNFIDMPLERYISLNTRFSKQYKDEKDVLRKQEIIKNIYELDIPLFKAWQVFNREDREDFEQEAFLWIERALETYKPNQGAFLHWLKRYYVLKSWTSECLRNKKQLVMQPLDGTEEEKGLDLDSVFWKSIRKMCDEDEWDILTGVFFEGQTYADLEQSIGKKKLWIEKTKSAIFQRIKDFRVRGQQVSNTDPDFFKKDFWLPISNFADKMVYTNQHVRSLLTNRKTGYYIDKRDIIKEPQVRIHYSTDAAGAMILPRFHYRSRTKKEKPS